MKKLFVFPVLFISLAFITPQEDYCSGGQTYYSLEEALKEPEKVKVLDIAMQDPKLTTLPKEITLLKNLECLDVSFNRISHLPQEMAELKNLKFINLAGNRYLANFPMVLKEISSLKMVDFTSIPEWSQAKCDQAKQNLPNVKVKTDK